MAEATDKFFAGPPSGDSGASTSTPGKKKEPPLEEYQK